MRDSYYDLILENYDNILKLYLEFEEKRSVMLYDVLEERIYAYPYADYKNTLSMRSQETLKEQYEKAIQNGDFVVFVRDPKCRKLRSYTMEIN